MGTDPFSICKSGFTCPRGNDPRKLGSLLIALLLGGCSAGPVSAPVRLDPARFEPDIRAFEQADVKSPPAQGGVLFVGSSSIRLWKLDESFPGLHALNRGFGGSQIADCTAFVERIVLPYRPTRIFFYAGDNDIAAGKSPKVLLEDWQRFRKSVHAKLLDARIVFLSVKPSPNRWTLWPQAKQANALIEADCAADPRLKYLDVAAPMLDATGAPRAELFLDDHLHMNAEGYKLWAAIVAPHLQ